GEFSVLEGLDSLSKRQLGVLKALTAHSNHPVAKALYAAIKENPLVLERVEERIGRGMLGQLKGDTFLLGSATFMQENGMDVVLPHTSAILLFFAENGHLTANLALGDSVRAGAKEVLRELTPNVLLSGDGQAAVEAIARECGFTEWHW